MNHRYLIPSLLCALVAICGCEKDLPHHNMGAAVTLQFKDKAIFNDNGPTTEVQFVDLIEDSRCPADVQCIWEGRAVVQFTVNDTSELVLGIGNLRRGTDIAFVQEDTIGNYRFELLMVSFGTENHRNQERNYVATLRVDRN